VIHSAIKGRPSGRPACFQGHRRLAVVANRFPPKRLAKASPNALDIIREPAPARRPRKERGGLSIVISYRRTRSRNWRSNGVLSLLSTDCQIDGRHYDTVMPSTATARRANTRIEVHTYKTRISPLLVREPQQAKHTSNTRHRRHPVIVHNYGSRFGWVSISVQARLSPTSANGDAVLRLELLIGLHQQPPSGVCRANRRERPCC
jgi:hypothetical protein